MPSTENVDVPAENVETVPVVPKSSWQKPFLFVVIFAFSMLLGAGAATGVFLVTGLPGQPVHTFAVYVYLETDATAEQKAAVQAALPAFDPTGEVKFTSREEAWKHFQELGKSNPEILQGAKMEYLPESFGLETKGRLFDCAGYTKVRHMPGVNKVQVIQDRVNGYVATITCDAEYATR
ncbi:permease-like cell division protein FtsX [Actinoplanes sp. HUAS TT8]|uniref:permease-like cell division protein FtsX n=1 Tax=Actinoplanes sp. HUAS TT8 TaxID=3447453 RepID=UPI003F524821